LRKGLLYRGESGRGRLTGELMPQATVRRGDETGLFDDIVGTGFVLLTAEDPRPYLDESAVACMESLGARLALVAPVNNPATDEHTVADVDDVYLPYLARADARAVLVRPDFYIFGQVSTTKEYRIIFADLRQQLGAVTSIR
jgi:flavoprotein hydroxylase